MSDDHRTAYRWMLLAFLVVALLVMTGCGSPARDAHLAKQAANIVITAEAQLAGADITLTAEAIKHAAEAQLKLLDYEIDR